MHDVERKQPAYVSLTREERRFILEIAALENRDLRAQIKKFVDEGIERRQQLMRSVHQLVAACTSTDCTEPDCPCPCHVRDAR